MSHLCHNVTALIESEMTYYCFNLEYLVVSGHVMAIHSKWHMCPCHEPLVAQISKVPLLQTGFRNVASIYTMPTHACPIRIYPTPRAAAIHCLTPERNRNAFDWLIHLPWYPVSQLQTEHTRDPLSPQEGEERPTSVPFEQSQEQIGSTSIVTCPNPTNAYVTLCVLWPSGS